MISGQVGLRDVKAAIPEEVWAQASFLEEPLNCPVHEIVARGGARGADIADYTPQLAMIVPAKQRALNCAAAPRSYCHVPCIRQLTRPQTLSAARGEDSGLCAC